jgi:apolipoprotein D and lipocalin family protein
MKIKTLAALGAMALAGLALSGCAAAFSKHPVGNAAVPQPAAPVELQRYLGRWYELARYEQAFQKDCDGVTADYALRPDGAISVLNACRKPDGSFKQAKGKAKVVDTATGAKLKVSFFGPFYGDYWVLDHAPDYSWSIVGEPSGRYLWILSREAQPGPAKVEALIARAKALGYDTSMLRITKQP